ncbi:hypothetical protein RRG08_033920 [Elysia crispata]|uniref:Uncharacterized protein n=1 Tax=Elysia crispata TaxID=231223 RepID=A0AAE1ECB3_9GAST|nr:hypothetical protein RRG08_033920 [Elysia crispata]
MLPNISSHKTESSIDLCRSQRNEMMSQVFERKRPTPVIVKEQPCSERPVLAPNSEHKFRIDDRGHADHQVKQMDISVKIIISHKHGQNGITSDLGNKKVSA